MLAISQSTIDPLLHQIEAVYGQMLTRQPLRFLLADDPGAGKTIMAGLYIKELMLRGDLERCLVVVPGSLVTQWQDELRERFGLSFEIVTKDLLDASYTGAEVLAGKPLLIARIDQLARREDVVERLGQMAWDLFAKCVYLPRLRDAEVLYAAVAQGPASITWQTEGFAVAHGFDEPSGRYLGLTVGAHPGPVTAATLVVRPEVALAQLDQEREVVDRPEGGGRPGSGGEGPRPGPRPEARRPPVRFHGTVDLDVTRLSTAFRAITQEVVDHLTAQLGAEVTVRVEVEAVKLDGFGDDVVRWVTENSRTLKFDPASGFEDA